MHIPNYANALVRTEHSESQTRKHRYNRWQNVSDLFTTNPEFDPKGKHLLLIDDVITTGATLEACALALLQNHQTRVSIAAIALPIRG